MKNMYKKMMSVVLLHLLNSSLMRLCVHIKNVLCNFRINDFLFAQKMIVIGMATGMMAVATAENITIHPANPKSLESVVLRIHSYNMCLNGFPSTQVKQISSTIRVDLRTGNCNIGFVALPNSIMDVDIKLGQLPSGVFNVDIFETIDLPSGGAGIQPRQLGSVQFTVTDNNAGKTGPVPLVDYTDHWWNPQESGMGFSIMQHPSDRIFAAWFVYDQAGQPIWYTLQPGQWLSSTAYSGPIYKTTGTYLGTTYNPGQLTVTSVGTGTFIFHDYSSATFNYTVDGITGTKEITRLSF
ncbi:hypothetical protein [Candidatus Nitrotoga sp. AM1P]|uniref:hypothetical protein n=1 Tax=Candidatus Nitrotoga sp. AM1P TaxID=2559597 RepID=UPI0010B5B4AD|nr:hypothetical protein [Candidatus Nitrotoga sp. AM1P]BBJ24451.1 hypothetical protein W01_23780 [Candidatus Nitrotoga sp. AM1P]